MDSRGPKEIISEGISNPPPDSEGLYYCIHCNQNGLEKLDHLLGYDFGKDDRSKGAIGSKICL